jgi:hypothetical protein
MSYPNIPFPVAAASSQYGSGLGTILTSPFGKTPGNAQYAQIYAVNNAYAQQQAHNLVMQQLNSNAITNMTPVKADIVNLRGTKGILRAFDGSHGEDISQWLEEYRLWGDENEFKKEKRAHYVQFALRGAAYKWWVTTGQNMSLDWPAMKTSLKSHFNNVETKQYWARQFDTISQLPTEKIQDYIYRFNSIQQRGYPDLAAAQKATKFADSLNRDFRQHVYTLQEINANLTFENMASKLIRYEARVMTMDNYHDPYAVQQSAGLYATQMPAGVYSYSGAAMPTSVSSTLLYGQSAPVQSEGTPFTGQPPMFSPIPYPATPEMMRPNAPTETPSTPMRAQPSAAPAEPQPVRYVEAQTIENTLQGIRHQMNRIERQQKKRGNQDFRQGPPKWQEKKARQEAERADNYKDTAPQELICYNCHKPGHKAYQCPERKQDQSGIPRGNARREHPGKPTAPYRPQYGNQTAYFNGPPGKPPQVAPQKVRHIQEGEGRPQ